LSADAPKAAIIWRLWTLCHNTFESRPFFDNTGTAHREVSGVPAAKSYAEVRAMPSSTLSTDRDASAKTPGGESANPITAEAVKTFLSESGPKVVAGLRKLHREKHPEMYQPIPAK
jgi:hypothetical protein